MRKNGKIAVFYSAVLIHSDVIYTFKRSATTKKQDDTFSIRSLSETIHLVVLSSMTGSLQIAKTTRHIANAKDIVRCQFWREQSVVELVRITGFDPRREER